MAINQLNEEDLKRLAEEEYFRLEGKFLSSESTKTHFSTRLKAVLIQQERVIDILENEKENLTKNIAVTKSKCYRGIEEKRLTSVFNCIEYEKVLDSEIMFERNEIKDLKTAIDNVKKEMIAFNKTDDEAKITESIIKSAKRVRDLEDKLQVATNKFNSMLTENAEHRKEIENLLNERKNFFKFYMRLYNQLLRGKQIMLDLAEQATMTYNQREEAYTKLKNLKEKTKAEKRIQSKDVQDLKRKLEIAEELYTFLSIKGQKRILADLEAREAREKKTQKEETIEKIQKYIVLLDKIKDLSDEKDIDKFVTRFKKSEEENLGLFNYVNDVNDEVEVLQSQVNSLLERIDEQKELNKQRSNDQLETINKLKNKLAAKEEEYAEAVDVLKGNEMLLTDLLYNIECMFLEFECNNQPTLALLGDNAHVNIFNVQLCLKLLESQLYEFIYIAYAKERLSPGDSQEGKIVQDDYHILASKRPLIYHIVKISPCPLCVETDRIFILDENNKTDELEGYEGVHDEIKEKIENPEEMIAVLHNISTCRLPRSRAIMQARFQEQEHEKVGVSN